MSWTMPRPVVLWAATLLGLIALTSFAMGIINAPERGGRLPGERVPGQGPATAINATEATPLSQERIEGPPPPPEKPAVNKTEEASADTANATTNTTMGPILPVPPAATVPPPANTTPAPLPEDEPPH